MNHGGYILFELFWEMLKFLGKQLKKFFHQVFPRFFIKKK